MKQRKNDAKKPEKKVAGDSMPPICAIEREKCKYIDGMRAYLEKVRALTGDEAIEDAKRSLYAAGITDENGKINKIYRNDD